MNDDPCTILPMPGSFDELEGIVTLANEQFLLTGKGITVGFPVELRDLSRSAVPFAELVDDEYLFAHNAFYAEEMENIEHDFSVAFSSVRADMLPETTIEWRVRAINEYVKDRQKYAFMFERRTYYDTPFSTPRNPPPPIHDMIDQLNKVCRLARSISKEGFFGDFPVLLTFVKGNGLLLQGGNHRVQAVRNLIKAGEIPASFPIPAVFAWETACHV